VAGRGDDDMLHISMATGRLLTRMLDRVEKRIRTSEQFEE